VRIVVGHTADTHADEAHRLFEHDAVMSFIAKDMKERGCTLALHAGDWWERARTTAVERAAVADFVREVTNDMPLITVAGNHDSALDVEWLGRLRTKHAVHALTTPGVVVGPVVVGCLPWPRKANLLASLGRPVTHEESAAVAQDRLRDVLRGLGATMSGVAAPRILLAHVMIDGAETDHSQPIVGADMNVGLADLALARADYYACGHVHAAQRFEIAGAPCVYPSATRHNNFGEPGSKGYVVATFEDSGPAGAWRCIDVESVPTPCANMILLEDTWGTSPLPQDAPAEYDWLHGLNRQPPSAEYRGAEVRFRYTCDSDQRDAARAAANVVRDHILGRGAARVKLEEQVRPTTRARAPEVAKAITLEDQLAAVWATKRPELGDERRARLLSKLTEVRA